MASSTATSEVKMEAEDVATFVSPEITTEEAIDLVSVSTASMSMSEETASIKEDDVEVKEEAVLVDLVKDKVGGFTPGRKDSEGFLTPPPVSTLFIRRSRTNQAEGATYVVSPGSCRIVDKEHEAVAAAPEKVEESGGMVPFCGSNEPSPIGINSAPSNSGAGVGNHHKVTDPIRRRGRPAGTGIKYKKLSPAEKNVGEIRISSRASSSVFKHDHNHSRGSSPTMPDGPWVYPSPFKRSGGKPSIRSPLKPFYKGKRKESTMNIDPLTGKRRYTKRKKIGMEKKSKPSFDSEGGPAKVHLSSNGVWRPTDDLRLIVNTLSVGDLSIVHQGVKFSCNFSYKELEERWRKLMYGEKASLVSQNAINALHPNVKASIYANALFNADEEALIGGVKNVPHSNPDLSIFQALLYDNPHIFNKYRTAKSLLMHWLDMRDFHLLPNQNVIDYDPAAYFEDFEETLCDETILNEVKDDSILQELKIEDRSVKKRIRILEDEVTAWQALIDQIIDDGRKDRTLPLMPAQFDGKTLAVLRGKEVIYVMTSWEIILGRSVPGNEVDADLTQEGSSSKISRKQAIIKLKDMGKFVIHNLGRHCIFVDRKAVPHMCCASLHDQSVIQIAHIALVFLINESLVAKIVERDVRREIFASFKDLETETPPSTSCNNISEIGKQVPKPL